MTASAPSISVGGYQPFTVSVGDSVVVVSGALFNRREVGSVKRILATQLIVGLGDTDIRFTARAGMEVGSYRPRSLEKHDPATETERALATEAQEKHTKALADFLDAARRCHDLPTSTLTALRAHILKTLAGEVSP